MSCTDCDNKNEGQGTICYYRWKDANIGMMGCNEHLMEVFRALNDAQEKEKEDGGKANCN